MKKFFYFIFFFLIHKNESFSLQRRDILKGVVETGSSFGLLANTKIKDSLQVNNLEEKNNDEIGILQETYNKLYFYGPVNQRSCFELKRQINDMNIKLKTLSIQYNIDTPPIHLHIQSQGGSLYHSLYIIDLIRNIDNDIYTYIDGFAASAATLMSVVGKKRYMTKSSLMLIHQLSGADSGKFNELQDQMTNMSILMNMITNIYLEETKINKTTLNELLTKDLWLDADTCLKYGLVDEII